MFNVIQILPQDEAPVKRILKFSETYLIALPAPSRRQRKTTCAVVFIKAHMVHQYKAFRAFHTSRPVASQMNLWIYVKSQTGIP